MGKKIGILVVALLMCSVAMAQGGDTKAGLLRSGLGLKIGTATAFSSFYGSGELEYYIDDKVSVEGESNYFLGTLSEVLNYDIINHHSVMTGINYHFKPGFGFDPYAGLKVGASFSEIDRVNHETGTECYEKLQVDPITAIQLGFNYFTGKYFHMFMEAGYKMQKHNTMANPGLRLNEFSFKFGLGYHVSWFQKHKATKVTYP